MMKKLLSLLLVFAIILTTVALAVPAGAAELRAVKIKGSYHQTQARAVLNKINNFRTGSNAWAWDEDNEYIVYYRGLSDYTYDYDLEKIAMQRAAELAVFYASDHTRTDGTSWQTAHTVYNPSTGVSIGENIFAVTNSTAVKSATEAFNTWLEEDEYYEGQGHRRNMLGITEPFVTTALACFEVDETFYWVGLFRSSCIGKKQTTVTTDKVAVEVNLSNQYVHGMTWAETETDLEMEIGQNLELWPEAWLESTAYTNGSETIYIPALVSIKPSLKSSDPNIVSVSGNKLIAKSAGNCSVTATAFGVSLTYQIYVDKIDISNAVITLTQPQDTYIYTGSMIKPVIQSVKVGSNTLTVFDYDVVYAENTEVGNGTIAIVGMGNYTGSAGKSFKIIYKSDCPHEIVFDAAVQGTCRTKGMSAGTHCSICGEVFIKQEETDFGDHVKVITTAAKAATCTVDGTTEGAYCSVCGDILSTAQVIKAPGHRFPEAFTTLKATLSSNGKIYRICPVCKEEDCASTKVISHPQTFTLSKTAFTYNGKTQKPALTVKDADGNRIGTASYTAKVPTAKNVGRYKITVIFKGNYAGTKTLTFDILPKNTPKMTVTAARKAFKLKWTTQKVQTKGYQIQYSAYSNFRGGKSFTLKSNQINAATISKLTGGKTYYVRMRTYQTVKYAGKTFTIYSAWSAKKSVKTKK